MVLARHTVFFMDHAEQNFHAGDHVELMESPSNYQVKYVGGIHPPMGVNRRIRGWERDSVCTLFLSPALHLRM